MLDHCRALETDSTELEWSPLPSPSALVFMWSKYAPPLKGERLVARLKAECVLDAAPMMCLAHNFAAFSRVNMRVSEEESNPARLIIEKRSAHDFTWATVKKMPRLVHDREVIGRELAFTDTETGAFIKIFEPPSQPVEPDYGAKLSIVRSLARGYFLFAPIPGKANQCKLTTYQFIDVGGHVPTFLANHGAMKVRLLLFVVRMRDDFQRDDEVDLEEQAELAGVVEREQQVYDEEEERFVTHARDKLSGLKEEEFEELDSHDFLVKMHSNVKEEHGFGVGRASTVCLSRPFVARFAPSSNSSSM
jgi:hypothetical protein